MRRRPFPFLVCCYEEDSGVLRDKQQSALISSDLRCHACYPVGTGLGAQTTSLLRYFFFPSTRRSGRPQPTKGTIDPPQRLT